jgi:alpha-amylase
MGVLLQGFYFGPGRIAGVPSPLDGDKSVPFWWDHLASQANELSKAGFTAIWLPPPLKGASGPFSSGYDLFDDYDLGFKDQKHTIPTRYGSRQALARCTAVMHANDVDVYVDLVENQRDGDDGHFNFKYVNAAGEKSGGRFEKGPGDFHPHVPQDPGVFSDQFQFGRDLAPITGLPRNHCRDGLLNAADWLTSAIDLQGFRLDNMKGVSTDFIVQLLSHGALANKFAVGEFADGNLQLVQGWANAVGHRSAAFDFPLHFMLKTMCNDPGAFDMGTLDHAGLAGVDPSGAVTFVENHDTDRGGVGGPIVRNKLLAYAFILTSEGYPCVFYRDYSTDKNCFGLKPKIDPLIHVHENFAAGATQQRWKDSGVFAFERLGGDHLLVALNKETMSRRITVDTGFRPNSNLHDLTSGTGSVRAGGDSRVTLTIPPNIDGKGYICYSPRKPSTPRTRAQRQTVQVSVGAPDLDLKPAIENQIIEVARPFAAASSTIVLHLTIDTNGWTAASSVRVEVSDHTGTVVATKSFDKAAAAPALLSVPIHVDGFYTVSLLASNLPAGNKAPKYSVAIRYTAPKKLGA